MLANNELHCKLTKEKDRQKKSVQLYRWFELYFSYIIYTLYLEMLLGLLLASSITFVTFDCETD